MLSTSWVYRQMQHALHDFGDADRLFYSELVPASVELDQRSSNFAYGPDIDRITADSARFGPGWAWIRPTLER